VLSTACRSDRAAHRGTVLDVTRTAGSLFAPSAGLLRDYRPGRCSWAAYERRYTQEMRALWRRDPQALLDLVEQAAAGPATLVCCERGDEATVRCHRRLLKDLRVQVAARRGLVIDPDTDELTAAAIQGGGRSAPE
jgi:uncharacterized protein YeaO (DUF488 family)